VRFGVVAAGLVTIEAGGIDGGVASAFLDGRAEKRTPRRSGNPLKPRAENSVVRKSGESDLLKDAGHF